MIGHHQHRAPANRLRSIYILLIGINAALGYDIYRTPVEGADGERGGTVGAEHDVVARANERVGLSSGLRIRVLGCKG